MGTTLPSWSFIETFRVPAREEPSWASLAPFFAATREVLAAEAKELPVLLERWKQSRAGDLGPDPVTQDWNAFRPLRLHREEDWSDWLAWLLTTSTTGRFAQRLFSFNTPRVVDRPVSREENVDEGYRLDLLIWWSEDAATHVEVKVGDQNFEKTAPTAAAIEKKHAHQGRSFEHFILLPAEDVPTWEGVQKKDREAEAIAVGTLTWRQLAIAFRRSLVEDDEHLAWRAFSYVFAGAVSQQILGVGNVSFADAQESAEAAMRAAGAVRLMKEARE